MGSARKLQLQPLTRTDMLAVRSKRSLAEMQATQPQTTQSHNAQAEAWGWAHAGREEASGATASCERGCLGGYQLFSLFLSRLFFHNH